MTVSLKHKFTSAVADGGDTSLVQPSNWNDEHDLTLVAGKLVGRYSATNGAAQEVTPSTGLLLNTSTGNLTVDTTVVQAYDADLAGISSATFSANQVPISNGSNTWSGITVTTFAQSLLDDSNQATAQGTLGVVPGTDVQEWDADLDAIAALAGTSGFLKKTAANTWTLDTNSYATASHTHAISDVTNLQTTLDGKQPLATVLTNTTASFTTALETKLNGIEAGADVTDATNVAAAGAVMDGDFGSNGLMTRTGAGTYSVTTAPSGAIVGTTDSQTLTNKTLTEPVITGTVVEDIFALTDAATVDVDPGNGSIQTLTLAGTGRTLTFTNMVNGEAVTLMINDGTAGTITTWNATFVNGGGAPTLSTTAYTVVAVWKVGGVVYAATVGND